MTHDSAALDAQLDDLETVKQQALGQRDAVDEHVTHALNLLASTRLAAEQLASIHDDATGALDTVPAFHAELPDEVEGYADLDLPPIVRTLLGAFNRDRLAELQAGIDSAEGALRRYRDSVNGRYEAHHGDPVGWHAPKGRALALLEPIPFQLTGLDDVCMVKDCGKKSAHAFVIQDRITGEWKHHEKAPSASGPAECCASGSCEVCRGEV